MLAYVKSFFVATEVPDYIKLATGEIGVEEVRGGENPRIIEYHATTTLQATEDEVAWCSAFINWVMMKCGYKRTHSAAARSWLQLQPQAKKFQKHWIVVFKRGNSEWQGHVALAMKEDREMILCLGGNQSDKVCLQWYSKANVLGYVEPTPLNQPNV